MDNNSYLSRDDSVISDVYSSRAGSVSRYGSHQRDEFHTNTHPALLAARGFHPSYFPEVLRNPMLFLHPQNSYQYQQLMQRQMYDIQLKALQEQQQQQQQQQQQPQRVEKNR